MFKTAFKCSNRLRFSNTQWQLIPQLYCLDSKGVTIAFRSGQRYFKEVVSAGTETLTMKGVRPQELKPFFKVRRSNRMVKDGIKESEGM